MWAAADGHADVGRALLAAGADFRTPLPSGFTPLALRRARRPHRRRPRPAQGGGRRERGDPARRRAVREAPSPGPARCILAVENGHFELAVALVKAGADPNDQRSGLHAAAHAVLGPQAEPRRRRRRRPAADRLRQADQPGVRQGAGRPRRRREPAARSRACRAGHPQHGRRDAVPRWRRRPRTCRSCGLLVELGADPTAAERRRHARR